MGKKKPLLVLVGDGFDGDNTDEPEGVPMNIMGVNEMLLTLSEIARDGENRKAQLGALNRLYNYWAAPPEGFKLAVANQELHLLGKKKSATLQEASRNLLATTLPGGGTLADQIALTLGRRALAGDRAAIQELADRAEGRPRQSIDLNSSEAQREARAVSTFRNLVVHGLKTARIAGEQVTVEEIWIRVSETQRVLHGTDIAPLRDLVLSNLVEEDTGEPEGGWPESESKLPS